MGINFTFVPVPYQVMFINVVNVMWSCYMSYVSTNYSNRASKL
jgi:hypothetical protein